MLKLNLTTQFKHDLKLCKKRGYNINLLNAIVNTLRIPAALPPKNKDHSLKGKYWHTLRSVRGIKAQNHAIFTQERKNSYAGSYRRKNTAAQSHS